ncbi:hypothetical protein GA0070216_1231 [Micromonospora matsumotoense]|uniref:Beta/Gamma crystallin n=1 Tax=Micromonospora matsumotoense TaxID=121616 RepID=A0A1C5AR12_9ACTN|nr:hypothetical protein [Micromonospora matsumotoense]SCF47586.1 hypothetical protein GA0070216_1231 [Micromonospora matsumotoense]
MRQFTSRIAAGLAAALITTLALTIPASPAAAVETLKVPDVGLVFYQATTQIIVGRQATPDGICRPVPTEAIWAIGWNGFGSVSGYRTSDCAGTAAELNNFHSWPYEGYYLSYRAG